MSVDQGTTMPYEPLAGAHDEMVDASGRVRPSWSLVHDALHALGPSGLARQDARIRRMLHGHGTTFQIHGDGDAEWGLDPVPVVIAREDWDRLSAGIEQRARLLDLVLADLYGERRLLTRGLVPPDVVLRSADYLHACVGIRPPGDRHLVFHAADVARGADGEWTVLADRCEGPSGAGYALENREVLARSYPELLRRAGVRRVVDWFESVQAAMAGLAPAGVDDPRIVLFTGGPESRTYFEHSFLARSLGYSLVEADDLTVRGGRVWLKSVSGLEPVHVILRRVWGREADSLELMPRRGTGVAGLVEAARRGSVALANPLGSAVASAPALAPFLPELCRTLLGEEQILPTAPTWWCGDPAARSHVMANLDRMVVKPLNRPDGRSSRFGSLLDAEGREDLVRRVDADPHLWIGQEEISLPTSPSLVGRTRGRTGAGADQPQPQTQTQMQTNGVQSQSTVAGVDAPDTLEPRYTLLRTFAVAGAEPGGYAVMEGALARSAPHRDRITIFEGGSSKDTWITDPGVHGVTVPPRRRLLPQVDLRSSISSRVAESMFWIGRNLERATASVRLVHAVDRYLDQWPELGEEAGGEWIRTVESAVVDLVGATAPNRQTDTTAGLLVAAMTDLSRPRSLATSLRFLVVGSRTVRELFSTDSWRLLTDLGELAGALPDASPDQAEELALRVINPLAALSGLLTESMVRDPGWRFLDAGRRLERARLVASFLRTTMVEPVGGWVAGPMDEMVLSVWESLAAYRRRHRSDIEAAALLALLLLDPSNPRAVRASLDQLVDDLEALPGGVAGGAAAAAAQARALVVGRSGVELATVDGGRRHDLDRLVDGVLDRLDDVGDAMSRQYFTHVRATPLVGHRGRRR